MLRAREDGNAQMATACDSNQTQTSKPRRRTNGRRHNALKHGIFGTDIVILDESQEEFDKFHQRFIEEHTPQGVSEERCVLRLAWLYWCKPRIDRLFKDQIERAELPPQEADQVVTILMFEQLSMPGINRNLWAYATQLLPEFQRNCLLANLKEPPNDEDENWLD